MYVNRLKILILGFILSILFFFSHPQSVFADPIGAWSSTANLPTNIASHVSAFESGKVFVFGGANVDDYSDVFSSTPNSDGTLPGWTLISNLPETRYWGALVKKEKRLYILGGAMFTGITNYKNTVYSATIQVDGSISSWQLLVPLPENRALGQAVVVGNRIYYAGGRLNDATKKSEVYSAIINPDGTLGAWSTIANLPTAMEGFGMVEFENNIIIVGGANAANVHQSKVYKASVAPDGSLNPWEELVSLPEPVFRGATIRVDDVLISVGGENGLTVLNKVYYTNINGDGTLTGWNQSASLLPQPVSAASVTSSGDYLYLSGGWNGNYLDTVYYAPVNLSEGIDLPVPLLKQTNPLWGSFLYDSADDWAPFGEQDISNWGCAMTSAAMVFQYHGINKLPDDSDLDPGTLNSWLNSEPDGYIRNGLVNWLALSRLSRIAASNNPGFAHSALEYRRVNGEDKPQLTLDLQNGIPGILEEPGHFIVGKGIAGSSFSINDPFYDRTSLSDYSNTFLSLGRFEPSDTDLSYIMLVVDQELEMSVSSPSGALVGESFVQAPIDNDEGDGTSGNPLKIFYLPVPENGAYSVELSSQSINNYKLDSYLYDLNGNVKIATFSGIVGPNDSDIYSIQFNKEDSNNSSSNKNITFDSLIADIKSLHSLHEVNFRYYVSLLAQAKTAKVLSGRNIAKRGVIALLKAVDKQILRAKGHGVSNNAYNILHNDIQILLTSFSP